MVVEIVLAAVLLVLLLVSSWTFFYQLIKQQWRLLLRLEDVERRLTQGGAGAGVGSETDPQGLRVGTPLRTLRVPPPEPDGGLLDKPRS